MPDRDIILAKVATIDRCLARILEMRGPRGATLLPVDVDDIVILNLQRAAQAAIDLGAHVVAAERLGLPDSLAATFTLLEKTGILSPVLAERMRKMTGFRNIAVHTYEAVNSAVVDAIVTRHLGDLKDFGALMLARYAHP